MAFEVPDFIARYIKEREGSRPDVYTDSIKDGRQTYAFGFGSQLNEEEAQQFSEGDIVPEEYRDLRFQRDLSRSYNAALEQASELGVEPTPEFIRGLTSANYQLGTNWTKEHKNTWESIRAGNWSEAAREAENSDWFGQTPNRVRDFQESVLSMSGGPRPLVEESPNGPIQDGFYWLNLPDGSIVRVASYLSEEEALEKARMSYPDAFPSASRAEDSGPIDAFWATANRAGRGLFPGLKMALAAASGDEESYDAAASEIRKATEEASRIAPNLVSLDEIVDTYNNEGVGSAVGKVFEFGAEQIGSSFGFQAPSAAASLGGYAVGALALGLGPVGAAALATTAGLGTMMATFLSSDLERAYEEGNAKDTEDLNLLGSIAAAGGQTALNSLSYLLMGGGSVAKGLMGAGLTPKGKSIAQTAFAKTIQDLDKMHPVKQIAAILLEEEVAEVAQGALERAAAGLPVSPSDQEALDEYIEIMFATLAPGAGFGVGKVGASYMSKRSERVSEQKFTDWKKRVNESGRASYKEEEARASENFQRLADQIESEIDAEVEAIRIEDDDVVNALVEERRLATEEMKQKVRAGRSNSKEIKTFEKQVKVINDRLEKERKKKEKERNEKIRQDTGRLYNVTPEDIHKAARIRNIRSDDDPGFMIWMSRVKDSSGNPIGSYSLDSIKNDQDKLQSVMRVLSALPVQDREISFAGPTKDDVISVASSWFPSLKRNTLTVTSLKRNIKAKKSSALSHEMSDAIAEKYLESMVRYGLATRSVRNGKTSYEKNTVLNQDLEGLYQKILPQWSGSKNRAFPSNASLRDSLVVPDSVKEEYEVTDEWVYDKLRLAAIARGFDAKVKGLQNKGYSVEVERRDGSSQSTFHKTLVAAKEAASSILNRDDRAIVSIQDSEEIPSISYGNEYSVENLSGTSIWEVLDPNGNVVAHRSSESKAKSAAEGFSNNVWVADYVDEKTGRPRSVRARDRFNANRLVRELIDSRSESAREEARAVAELASNLQIPLSDVESFSDSENISLSAALDALAQSFPPPARIGPREFDDLFLYKSQLSDRLENLRGKPESLSPDVVAEGLVFASGAKPGPTGLFRQIWMEEMGLDLAPMARLVAPVFLYDHTGRSPDAKPKMSELAGLLSATYGERGESLRASPGAKSSRQFFTIPNVIDLSDKKYLPYPAGITLFIDNLDPDFEVDGLDIHLPQAPEELKNFLRSGGMKNEDQLIEAMANHWVAEDYLANPDQDFSGEPDSLDDRGEWIKFFQDSVADEAGGNPLMPYSFLEDFSMGVEDTTSLEAYKSANQVYPGFIGQAYYVEEIFNFIYPGRAVDLDSRPSSGSVPSQLIETKLAGSTGKRPKLNSKNQIKRAYASVLEDAIERIDSQIDASRSAEASAVQRESFYTEEEVSSFGSRAASREKKKLKSEISPTIRKVASPEHSFSRVNSGYVVRDKSIGENGRVRSSKPVAVFQTKEEADSFVRDLKEARSVGEVSSGREYGPAKSRAIRRARAGLEAEVERRVGAARPVVSGTPLPVFEGLPVVSEEGIEELAMSPEERAEAVDRRALERTLQRTGRSPIGPQRPRVTRGRRKETREAARDFVRESVENRVIARLSELADQIDSGRVGELSDSAKQNQLKPETVARLKAGKVKPIWIRDLEGISSAVLDSMGIPVQLRFFAAKEGQDVGAEFLTESMVIQIALEPGLESKSPAEQYAAIEPYLNHEIIHAVRRLGVIKASEWSKLTKFVETNPFPKVDLDAINVGRRDAKLSVIPEGSTYIEVAKILYAGEAVHKRYRDRLDQSLSEGNVSRQQYDAIKSRLDKQNWIYDDFVEEAVATAYQHYVRDLRIDKKSAEKAPDVEKGTFARILEFFRKMGQSLRRRGVSTPEQIFENFRGEETFKSRLQRGKALDSWYLRRAESPEFLALRDQYKQIGSVPLNPQSIDPMIEAQAVAEGVSSTHGRDDGTAEFAERWLRDARKSSPLSRRAFPPGGDAFDPIPVVPSDSPSLTLDDYTFGRLDVNRSGKVGESFRVTVPSGVDRAGRTSDADEEPVRKKILAACTEGKCPMPDDDQVAAKDLYTGTTFKQAKNVSESTGADIPVIISGLHGVVDPEEMLSDYNERVPSNESEALALVSGDDQLQKFVSLLSGSPTPRAADSLIESMPNEVYLHGNRMYRLMYRDLIRRGKEAGLIPEGMVVVEPESRVEGSSPDLIDQRRSLANWGDKIRKEKARPVSFGARLLDSGQKESSVRDNTTYSSWKGLLEGFLQRVRDFPDVFKNREVIVTNPSFEQVNVIWNSPDFQNPAVFVMEFTSDPVSDRSKGNPSNDFWSVLDINTDGSYHFDYFGQMANQAELPLRGPDVSASAVVAAERPDLAAEESPSENKRFALNNYSEKLSKEHQDIVDSIVGDMPSSSNSLIGTVYSAIPNIDNKWISKLRTAFVDKYNRLWEMGYLVNAKVGNPVGVMADTSAHAAALQVERSSSFYAAMLNHGYIEFGKPSTTSSRQQEQYAGTPRVVDYELENTATDTIVDFDTETGEVRRASFSPDSTPGLRNVYSGTGGLIQILQPLAPPNKNLLREFFSYARAVRAYRLQYAPDGPGLPGNLTKEEVRGGLRFAEIHPEIAVVHHNLQNWNSKIVDFLKDTGVITEDQSVTLKDSRDYIPFYKDMGENSGPLVDILGMEFDNDSSKKIAYALSTGIPFDKIKGGKYPIMEPIEAISRNAMGLVTAGLKNVARNRAIRDAEILGTAEKRNRAGNDTQIVYIDGIKQHYKVTDELLTNVLVGVFDGHHPVLDRMISLFRPAATFLREGVTRSPDFIFANILRDSVQSWALGSQVKMPVTQAIANYSRNLAAQFRGDATEEYKQLSRYGAVGGYELLGVDPKKLKRIFVSKIEGTNSFMKFWDSWGEASARSEAAIRESVYKDVYSRTLKNLEYRGYSDLDERKRLAESDAAYQAREVLNFSRRGSSPWVGFFTAVVPFMNARMQGLDRLYRAYTIGESTGTLSNEKAKSVMIQRGLMIAGVSMMYAIISYDDEDFENVRRETRQDNWLIPLPFSWRKNHPEDPKFFALPIPFEIGTFWKVLPETIVRTMMGGTSEEALDTLRRSVVSTLAMNPTPQLAKPMFEYVSNYNFWTGMAIVPPYMTRTAPEAQFRPTTSSLAKFVGEFSSEIPVIPTVSPLKFENLIRGYLGTLGIYGLEAADNALHMVGFGLPVLPDTKFVDYPFVKRFLKDGLEGGLRSEYYAMSGQVQEAVDTLNRYEQYGDAGKAAEYKKGKASELSLREFKRRVDKELNEIRLMKNNIYLSKNLNDSQKLEMMRNLEIRELKILNQVPEIRKRFSV